MGIRMCKPRKRQNPPSYTELEDEKIETSPDYFEEFDIANLENPLNAHTKLAEARRKCEENDTPYRQRELRCAEMRVALEIQYGTEFVQRNMSDILAYVEMYRAEMATAPSVSRPFVNSSKMRAKLDEKFASSN